MSDSKHLTEHQISASVDGVLQGSSQEQVLRHLADCDECRGRYEELVQHHQMLAALLAHEADDAFFSALEADVERALGAADVLPRGSAVVSIRSGPSKPASTSTPRPTMTDALGAIGSRPSWAPPAGATGSGRTPPERADEAAAPVAKPKPIPAPPAPVSRLETPPVRRAPELPYVFPDEVFEQEEAEAAALEAAEHARRARRGRIPVLSLALAAVAVIAVATIAVMLLRRGHDARPLPETSSSAARVMPVPGLPAGDTSAPSTPPPDSAEPSAAVAPATVAPAETTPAPARVTPPKRAADAAADTPGTLANRPSEKPKPPAAERRRATVAAKGTPARSATAAAVRASGPARMCGVVRDANGNPVARAQVLVSGLTLGAITNESGRFCLTVPSGAQELRTSALGFSAGTQPVTVAPGMDEVTITLRTGDATP